ncbi:hypothetical protein K7432_004465 [Basidiobolus ranarum]|uniref:Uncharacterized protein n=1 Tax=Basidiobolus ranarum TaxID=34480 RepID=A0ABR2WY73_9FUNG
MFMSIIPFLLLPIKSAYLSRLSLAYFFTSLSFKLRGFIFLLQPLPYSTFPPLIDICFVMGFNWCSILIFVTTSPPLLRLRGTISNPTCYIKTDVKFYIFLHK